MEKYNHDELPPIKNLFLYTYRAFMKLFFYFFFETGSVVLAILVFPWIRIFVHNPLKFQNAARKFVSASFSFFINFMRITGCVSLKVKDRDKFKNMHSKVIVANHPSMLDFVFIMSMVPNANCIVRGGLTKTVLAGVIKQAYIVNTLDFDQVCNLCKATLDEGNNVIIFPEGTRTPRHGTNPYKKGAARIAYYAGCDIIPVLVGGNDKFGLGKNDPFWSYNHTEKYVYDFRILEEIKIDKYKDLSDTIAAKRMTEKMQEIISAAIKENGKEYITNMDKTE